MVINNLLKHDGGELTGNLRDFKERYCDENSTIADLLKSDFSDHIIEPVLDVGAGLGDVAAGAFPHLPTILLDIKDWHAPIASRHRRIRGDFFSFANASDLRPGTVVFAHSLQYLDSDLAALRLAVGRLNPSTVITVTNDNEGTFGELMEWASTSIPDANIERPITPVPLDAYRLLRSKGFAATAAFPDFATMAEQVIAMFVDATPTAANVAATEAKLRQLFDSPIIKINETVRCYERI